MKKKNHVANIGQTKNSVTNIVSDTKCVRVVFSDVHKIFSHDKIKLLCAKISFIFFEQHSRYLKGEKKGEERAEGKKCSYFDMQSLYQFFGKF